MSQAARLLLTFGLVAGLASGAWAGPTTSPSPSGSPGPTATATATATPTATSTGSPVPTATATATPTATATATVTTSPSPSPTAAPGDLSGEHVFVDKVSFDKHETFFNVDTAAGDICVAGQVVGIDPTTTFNRRVTFTYEGQGTITKSSTKGVKGDFPSSSLRLMIEELSDPPTVEFDQTITTGCKLKGALKKSGEKDKVSLKCDVGQNLSAFGLETEENQDLLENVTDAYPRRSGMNANTKKGKIRFKTNGIPAPDGLIVPLSCDLGGSPTPTPTPAPE